MQLEVKSEQNVASFKQPPTVEPAKQNDKRSLLNDQLARVEENLRLARAERERQQVEILKN